MEGIDVIGTFMDSNQQESAPIKSEIIKIIGVGGAGCNAVNNVYKMGVPGVGLVVCNTDVQALEDSPVSCKIQLGKTLTEGLGAGNDPAVGSESAKEAKDEIDKVLKDNTKMVFIAAGMGGGTGTGAAPVIAKQAKDMKILTIGIVTIPPLAEGKPRIRQAIKGAEVLSECVDSLLVVNTERIFDICRGKNIDFELGLQMCDNIMALAAKGLAEMISKHRRVNVDFADVKNAMHDSGCSLIGTADAEGPDRAEIAVREALNSPLLNNNDISGATHVLLNISASPSAPMTTDEQEYILGIVNHKAGGEDNDQFQVIWGAGKDESIEDGKLRITIVATGFSHDVFATQQSKSAVEVNLANPKQDDDKDDEEKAQTMVYNDPEAIKLNQIMNTIYGKGNNSSSTDDFDPAKLRPATSLPLDKLSEEVLNDIERTPAYKRRSN